MKKIGLFLVLLCALPFVAAAVDIDAPDAMPIVIVGSDNESATYDITFTNRGASDDFELYSLVGVQLEPRTIRLESNVPTTITVTATPVKRLLDNTRGAIKFEYEVFSTLQGVTTDELLMDITTLESALFPHPVSVEVGDSEATFALQNVKNMHFNNLQLELSSALFEVEQKVTLRPFETTNMTFMLDSDATRKLVAGTYPLTITVRYAGAEGELESNVKYLEQGGIAVAESSRGAVIRTKTVEKINEGNVPVTVTISERRDIFTRLLTNHDPSPETSSKRGFSVIYTWQKELAPSEKLTVTATTNYTLPLIVLIAIIIIVIAVRFYLRTGLSLVKRVSFVRTRGGEFALKVTIHAKSHGHLQNVIITDRVPHAMKLYESYGIKPHAIDEASRSLTWNISHLNAGEERVFSYIIYSKIRVVGSFELPLAHARYAAKGKHESVFSNRTSFAAEIAQNRD